MNDSHKKRLKEQINDFLRNSTSINQHLWEELVYLRERPRKLRKRSQRDQLNRPVASFSKPDRLKKGMGKEITLIMRSKACSWAHSKAGGCTMCGYWNDRADIDITGENYWHQFKTVIKKYEDLLEDPTQQLVFKIFTSGSFCDSHEIPREIQLQILKTLVSYESIREIVVESRPEYLTHKMLVEYQEIIYDKYLEFGIGLESSNDYTRINLINKGFESQLFYEKIELLHSFNFGVKAYVLFKPPFLNEYSAIMDTYKTLQKCVQHHVDTISINPTNIQKHTICEELNKKNLFRPPWLFSLLWLIKHSFRQTDLTSTRVICDPSAKGKARGVHNCTPNDKSNKNCLRILEQFVRTQNLQIIPDNFDSVCFSEYILSLMVGKD